MYSEIELLNEAITGCRLCPRLVAWCEEIADLKRRAFLDQTYWGKPVPYFGDPEGDLLIVGLAPAAHGANRTGRMFTGDRSGDFLFASLFRCGLANQEKSQSSSDGLKLHRVLIAATAHCAPPANKPLPEEIENCSRYLSRILAMQQWRSVLCLGSIAWIHVHRLLKARPPRFGHGAESHVGSRMLFGSYHPSQQNTFTGKLTAEMLDQVVLTWSAEDAV